MMNMKLLAFVTPPSMYHGCFAWKTSWEEIFTGEKKLFSDVSMNNCGCQDVRKHIDIKVSDSHVTLEISLKFVSLVKMKITSSEKNII